MRQEVRVSAPFSCMGRVGRRLKSRLGPRPERPHFVERFSQSIPRYQYRHHEKAGITGWAQVNGLRGDTSIEERTRYDLYYIENWSPLFDIKIIVKTIWLVLRPGWDAY